MGAPHHDLRRLCRLAQNLVSEMPATSKSGSPRRTETSELRSTARGGGPGRARLLDRLNVDAQLMAANLTLIVEGVADCLEVATGRDNAVNRPALSFVVRPALEVAGQLAWLLDDSIDGTERARRFLTWRFADLRQLRLLLEDFRPSNEERTSTCDELDEVEKSFLDDVAAANWAAKATVAGPKGFEAAALLGAAGKRESMPKYNELVRLVSSTPSVYGLLSVPAHGVRFGIFHGLEVADTPDPSGRYSARIAGFGIEPNIGVGLAFLAVDVSCRLLAGWNGVDAGRLTSGGRGAGAPSRDRLIRPAAQKARGPAQLGTGPSVQLRTGASRGFVRAPGTGGPHASHAPEARPCSSPGPPRSSASAIPSPSPMPSPAIPAAVVEHIRVELPEGVTDLPMGQVEQVQDGSEDLSRGRERSGRLHPQGLLPRALATSASSPLER